MSTLRRVGSLPFIVLVPSFIFGLIHLGNNGVTFFSVCNIILAGLLLSVLWPCTVHAQFAAARAGESVSWMGVLDERSGREELTLPE